MRCLETGVETEAACNPEDLFTKEEGFAIACSRQDSPKVEPVPEIKVGDMVVVIESGKRYTTYEDFIKIAAPRYFGNYVNGSNNLCNGMVLKVVGYGYHSLLKERKLLVVQNEGTSQVFIIGQEGVKKIEEGAK